MRRGVAHLAGNALRLLLRLSELDLSMVLTSRNVGPSGAVKPKLSECHHVVLVVVFCFGHGCVKVGWAFRTSAHQDHELVAAKTSDRVDRPAAVRHPAVELGVLKESRLGATL
ncbi:MAG: hypothetical protein ACI9TF_001260 [Paracrocinitomix sp.]|jgi:hypothetical protein